MTIETVDGVLTDWADAVFRFQFVHTHTPALFYRLYCKFWKLYNTKIRKAAKTTENRFLYGRVCLPARLCLCLL